LQWKKHMIGHICAQYWYWKFMKMEMVPGFKDFPTVALK
jgi:hypothetical protein